MKVLFLVPYPLNSAPSQRFRFEQYFKYLDETGAEYKVQSFLDEKAWSVLYKKGNYWLKLWGVVRGFLRRDWQMFNLGPFDLVFIHREAAPVGPALFEWWIAKVLKKKIIYDFDDAIWLPNTSDENRIVASIKWHGKVSKICKWAGKVSAGNEYLADYARKFNDNVEVMPTTIDTGYHSSPSVLRIAEKKEAIPSYEEIGSSGPEGQVRNAELTIGWTGTHSTLPYLDLVYDALDILSSRFEFKFHIISNQPPDRQLAYGSWQLWRKETEIEDLNKIDIGIMPMPDDPWTQGKCGFKALQFMALGKAVVASPVGVNTDIIRDGENGFLVDTKQEWIEKLSLLIQDPKLRERLGKAGKQTVIEKYSVEANKERFLGLFGFE